MKEENKHRYDNAKEANKYLKTPYRLTCLECKKRWYYEIESNEAQGIFNCFCNGECEDKFAWKQ